METITVAWFLIVFVLFPIFYCMTYHENTRKDKLIYSVCFYLGGLLNIVVIFLPLWYFMLQTNPLKWILNTIARRKSRTNLLVYWLLLVTVSFAIVWWCYLRQRKVRGGGGGKRNTQIPKTIMRKTFHCIAVLIFLPSVQDQTFVAFAGGVAIVVFLVVEVVRIFKIVPFGEMVENLFQPLLEEHDTGKLIT